MEMLLNERLGLGFVVGAGDELLQICHSVIETFVQGVVGIPDVSDAAAHPGAKVSAGWPENDDASAGHVFAAVIADAFDDGVSGRVTDAESLAGDPSNECLAAS